MKKKKVILSDDRVYKVHDRMTGLFLCAGGSTFPRWSKSGKVWAAGALKAALRGKDVKIWWEVIMYEPTKFIACSLVKDHKLTREQIESIAIPLKKDDVL